MDNFTFPMPAISRTIEIDMRVILNEKELSIFVDKQVAPHKQLENRIIFVDAIPKSASGKILRKVLRDSLNKK